MNKLAGWTVLVTLVVAVVACGSNNDTPVPPEVEAEIVDRIAPDGEIKIASEESSAPAASTGGTRSGEEVYNSKCMICHASGTAGAPMIGKAEDWTPRIAQGTEALYTNAINGLNGMPPKGLCMDCSDDELKAAVDYLLEKSQ